MKRIILLFLVAGLLSIARIDGQGRSSFGAGRSHQGGHYGHSGFVGGRGHYGSNIRPYAMGGLKFFGSHQGAFYRHRFYSPGFFSPFYWADAYSEPFNDAELLMPEFLDGERLYYRRAPAPDVEPNCKDAWSGNPTTNSVSQTMSRIFEMQCENRHPSPDTELRHPARSHSGASNSATTPSEQN